MYKKNQPSPQGWGGSPVSHRPLAGACTCTGLAALHATQIRTSAPPMCAGLLVMEGCNTLMNLKLVMPWCLLWRFRNLLAPATPVLAAGGPCRAERAGAGGGAGAGRRGGRRRQCRGGRWGSQRRSARVRCPGTARQVARFTGAEPRQQRHQRALCVGPRAWATVESSLPNNVSASTLHVLPLQPHRAMHHRSGPCGLAAPLSAAWPHHPRTLSAAATLLPSCFHPLPAAAHRSSRPPFLRAAQETPEAAALRRTRTALIRTHIELGRLEMVAGESPDAAEGAYRSALALCHEVYGAGSREAAAPAFNLANCLRAIGKKGEPRSARCRGCTASGIAPLQIVTRPQQGALDAPRFG